MVKESDLTSLQVGNFLDSRSVEDENDVEINLIGLLVAVVLHFV